MILFVCNVFFVFIRILKKNGHTLPPRVTYKRIDLFIYSSTILILIFKFLHLVILYFFERPKTKNNSGFLDHDLARRSVQYCLLNQSDRGNKGIPCLYTYDINAYDHCFWYFVYNSIINTRRDDNQRLRFRLF